MAYLRSALPGDRKKQLELIDIESVLYNKHMVDRSNRIVLSRQTPEKTEGANKNWQSKETGNIGNTRHKTKRNKTKTTTQHVLDIIINK